MTGSSSWNFFIPTERYPSPGSVTAMLSIAPTSVVAVAVAPLPVPVGSLTVTDGVLV